MYCLFWLVHVISCYIKLMQVRPGYVKLVHGISYVWLSLFSIG